MAYGDATLQDPPIPWEEFEYVEYLWRLENLMQERNRAFDRACHPDGHFDVGGDWERIDREIEETAIEFAAYAARLRLRAA
jgi:hypothetical protein